MASGRRQKTIVVGAGPVGALAALYAAGRGNDVEVYELRGDLRDSSTVPLNFTKSINLALSERGINSMRKANAPGLLDAVLNDTIPMHGRMIHGKKHGKLFEEAQLYDAQGRFIRAADRAGLNKRLLDELNSMPNVKFFFHHKLVGADFKRNLAWFEVRSSSNSKETKEIEVSFDFLIGADGAHSAVRYHLMKYTRMSYHQEYIDTLWCEFHIPPLAPSDPNYSKYDGFALSPNHLHIWPGGSFMFIAIPSLDKSFTCTLFLPESRFSELDADHGALVPFFEKNFPGVVPDLISDSNLRTQYRENPHLPLISIKCSPYHYSSSAVILGDAAHAMVPFYGQGMNAGLEDVRVLYDVLDEHSVSSRASPEEVTVARGEALAAYSKTRHEDAATINDLALRNYEEMRDKVRSPVYLFRKMIEEKLSVWFPGVGIKTQYSRISFGNERYSDVRRAVSWQGKVLLGMINVVAIGGIASVALSMRIWLGGHPVRTSVGRDIKWLGAWIASTGDAIGRR
ncbi:FAD/NAD(P)-binding domain-containing protein [Rhizodiscina lignyota]|uniref:Kynurenine 3-monooxygenase n=1 Tax=Rhizodiscina lignyota TaxID=1504668 RepID=A0A9P4IKI2_9PEZI|nr:FAD/NAD(P)-binding domain-containing protein [Rhizodiscina lignyota]